MCNNSVLGSVISLFKDKGGKKEIAWINCAKGVAILAVMTDHLSSVLWNGDIIPLSSYFSVSLFVLLAGITAYISNERHDETWISSINRNVKKIVTSYLVATFIYQICYSKRFYFSDYLQNVIYFKISMHLYFVLLYVQLNIVNRPIYCFLKCCDDNIKGISKEMLGLITIVLFSIFSVNYTSILAVYGGGGKLLGGTFLIMYYLGMLFEKHNVFAIKSIQKRMIIFVVSIISLLGWFLFIVIDRFKLDTRLPWLSYTNPPGISLMVYAVIMLWVCFSVFTILKDIGIFACFIKAVSFIGKNSMAIFLYHMLFIEIVRPIYLSKNLSEKNWSARILYYFIMVVASVFVQHFVQFILMKLSDLIINNNTVN